jgi:hypothetical protein
MGQPVSRSEKFDMAAAAKEDTHVARLKIEAACAAADQGAWCPSQPDGGSKKGRI